MPEHMPEHLIPVVFDVTAPDEETAARIVSAVIGRGGLLRQIQDASRSGDDQMIESWWFPEARHKPVDGNDNAAMTLVYDDTDDETDDETTD